MKSTVDNYEENKKTLSNMLGIKFNMKGRQRSEFKI